MNKYSEKELLDWMAAQPDKNEVCMYDGSWSNDRDCLLTQFFKSKGEHGVFTYGWGALVGEDGGTVASIKLRKKSIFCYFLDDGKESKNFGDLKRALRGDLRAGQGEGQSVSNCLFKRASRLIRGPKRDILQYFLK